MIGPFYTYIHRRADDGLVFYVGKGKASRAHRRTTRSLHWQRIVEKHGLRVEIVAEWATEREAYDHERRLIAEHRSAGAPLCNRTDGGEGGPGHVVTEEVRARIRAKHLGKEIPPETRAKIGAANRGKKRSAEFRARVSAQGRLRPWSAETRAKISAALTGRTLSIETRQKIAATLRARAAQLGGCA